MKLDELLNPAPRTTLTEMGSISRKKSQASAKPPCERATRAKFVKRAPMAEVRYPPIVPTSQVVVEGQRGFRIWPEPHQMAEYSRYIPYSSTKLPFNEASGRDGVTVFQYEFHLDGLPYIVMWDYHTGFVRISTLFKCLGYAKTIPRDAIKATRGLKELSHSMTGGAIDAQGYWLPRKAAEALCEKFCFRIRYALTPLFGQEFAEHCLSPYSTAFENWQIPRYIIIVCRTELGRVTSNIDDIHQCNTNIKRNMTVQATTTFPAATRVRKLKSPTSSSSPEDSSDGEHDEVMLENSRAKPLLDGTSGGEPAMKTIGLHGIFTPRTRMLASQPRLPGKLMWEGLEGPRCPSSSSSPSATEFGVAQFAPGHRRRKNTSISSVASAHPPMHQQLADKLLLIPVDGHNPTSGSLPRKRARISSPERGTRPNTPQSDSGPPTPKKSKHGPGPDKLSLIPLTLLKSEAGPINSQKPLEASTPYHSSPDHGLVARSALPDHHTRSELGPSTTLGYVPSILKHAGVVSNRRTALKKFRFCADPLPLFHQRTCVTPECKLQHDMENRRFAEYNLALRDDRPQADLFLQTLLEPVREIANNLTERADCAKISYAQLLSDEPITQNMNALLSEEIQQRIRELEAFRHDTALEHDRIVEQSRKIRTKQGFACLAYEELLFPYIDREVRQLRGDSVDIYDIPRELTLRYCDLVEQEQASQTVGIDEAFSRSAKSQNHQMSSGTPAFSALKLPPIAGLVATLDYKERIAAIALVELRRLKPVIRRPLAYVTRNIFEMQEAPESVANKSRARSILPAPSDLVRNQTSVESTQPSDCAPSLQKPAFVNLVRDDPGTGPPTPLYQNWRRSLPSPVRRDIRAYDLTRTLPQIEVINSSDHEMVLPYPAAQRLPPQRVLGDPFVPSTKTHARTPPGPALQSSSGFRRARHSLSGPTTSHAPLFRGSIVSSTQTSWTGWTKEPPPASDRSVQHSGGQRNDATV